MIATPSTGAPGSRRTTAPSGLLRASVALCVLAGAALAVSSLAPSRVAPVRAAAPDASAPASESAAVDRLRRATDRARTRSWRARQSLRLTAAATGGPEMEVVADLRHDAMTGTSATVVSGGSQGARALGEVSGPDPLELGGTSPLAWSGTSPDSRWVSLVTSAYSVTMGPPAEASPGRDEVVELHSASGALAARLEIGKDSGLVVGRELYDTDGALLRVSTLADVVVGADALAAAPPERPHPTAAAKQPFAGGALGAADLQALRDAGWAAPTSLAPGLVLVDAWRTAAASSVPSPQVTASPVSSTSPRSVGSVGPASGDDGVVVLTWSDGLRSVELFQQVGRLAPARLSDWRPEQHAGATVLVQPGLPRQVTWAVGDIVCVLRADGGPALLDTALSALPRPARAGLGQRLLAGLGRVGGWIDPTR